MNPKIPDPTTIDSWPQAVVTIVLILAVLVVPSVLSYLANKRIKNVERTLTTNNGGSHVKDALDRIEAKQDQHAARLAALEEQRAGVLQSLLKRL